MTVKNKDGLMVRFIPNKAQRHVLARIKKMYNEDKIIRILLLKARQLGFSTLIEALIYAFTSQKENLNATIIADKLKGSNYILEMSKLFHEQCPDHLRASIKKSNEKVLEFDGTHSQIIVDTAENEDAGRKYTFRLVHLSEAAFFRNYDALMAGLSQAVPSLPRTMLIQETTANGFNHFKKEWDKAEAGETDYVPIFCPWYWAEEYSMSAPADFIVGDPSMGEATKDEPVLFDQMTKEGITFINQRLEWRRWCIRNNCQGKVSLFQQEYPSNSFEAFVASGECFFDKEKLAVQLRARLKMKPLYRANIVKINNGYEIRQAPDGDFYFFENRKADGQYCIGGDACSGSGLDYSALVVLDKLTNNVVAIHHGKLDPDQLAETAMLLGSFFNNAIIALENDKFGFAANRKLAQIYGNIYFQKKRTELDQEQKETIGWDTNSVTRPIMLAQLAEDIRQKATQLNFVPLIQECLTFIKNPDTKRVEAQEGCHDDLVIARAIAGAVRVEHPHQFKSDRKPGVDLKTRGDRLIKFSKRD